MLNIKELESDFINGKIIINNLGDVLEFKNKINNLSINNEQSSLEFIDILKDGLNCFSKYYENKSSLNEFIISNYFKNLKIICKYHQIRSKKLNIINKPNPNSNAIEMTDMFAKSYKIDENDAQDFKNIVSLEESLYLEFFLAYTSLFGSGKDKIKVIEKFDKTINYHRERLINGLIIVNDVQGFKLFKNIVLNLKRKYLNMAASLSYVNKMTILNSKNKDYLDLLENYLNIIEEKINNSEDISLLFSNLITIVKYNNINAEIKEIILLTKRHNDIEKVEKVDQFNNPVLIDILKVVKFDNLVKEANNLYDEYNKSISALDSGETVKRG